VGVYVFAPVEISCATVVVAPELTCNLLEGELVPIPRPVLVRRIPSDVLVENTNESPEALIDNACALPEDQKYNNDPFETAALPFTVRLPEPSVVPPPTTTFDETNFDPSNVSADPVVRTLEPLR
jgi:hypothetical protein